MRKYINRLLGFVAIMFILSILPFTVLASDTGLVSPSEEVVNEINFNITSGIDVKKEKESTFDKKRTITGTSDEGTSITIYVYTTKVDSDEKKSEDDEDSTVTYTIVVGASGIFSQAIELAIGENTVDITVEKEDYESINKTFIINRKNREIKQELEKTIILPGEGKTSQESSLEMIKR